MTRKPKPKPNDLDELATLIERFAVALKPLCGFEPVLLPSADVEFDYGAAMSLGTLRAIVEGLEKVRPVVLEDDEARPVHDQRKDSHGK